MPPPTTGTHQESNTKPTMSAAGPEKTKVTASAQLQKWSIARRIRSGEKLDRSDITRKPDSTNLNSQRSIDTWNGEGNVSEANINVEEDTYTSAPEIGGKAIYIVSDGTGWTAEHCVTAALRQFERCLIDRVCPVNTHLFSGVLDVDRLLEIIKQAAKDRALLLYTLADPSMAESASNASRIWGVPSTDVLGPVRDSIASHLGVSPTGLPRGARPEPLSDEYFKRIDCVEFTIKQDDGALPQNLNKADIILAGVSRTGKTPLSIYLSQKGYKVANVPIVKGINLPASIFQVDSSKVFGLTINPVTLRTIRRARARTLGFGDEIECTYSEMDHVRDELEYAGKIFAQNPIWPVIEVTGKAIEETAAVILRLYYDRKQKCSMPRISRRY